MRQLVNLSVSVSSGLVVRRITVWVDEVRQAAKHRQEAYRADRNYKNLSEKFPGEILQERVRENGKNISI